MERSRTIFLKIASAAKKVITSANEYANRKDKCRIPQSHHQLEDEMRRISVACEGIADILGKSKASPPDGPAVDIRLRDWLDTDEPEQCLDTLDGMQRLLRESEPSWGSWLFKGWAAAPAGDKIEEAAKRFDSRKGYFHFLSTIGIWNNEKHIRPEKDHAVRVESSVPEQTSSVATPMQVDSILLDPATGRQDEHVDHIIQKYSGVIHPQHSPITIQGDLVARLDVAIQQDTVVQGEEEMISDDQRKEEEEKKKERAKKLVEIERWLDGLNCAEKQDDTLLLRQPDTCKWLFDTAQYRKWRDGQDSFLWLRGKPGAGKSVLASSVVNSLETSPREGEILTFFYCDFRNERTTNSAEVLCSILSQLLRHLHHSVVHHESLVNDLNKVMERGGSTRKNAKELANFACCVAALSRERPLVVVDALDECKDVGTLLPALMVIRSHVQLFVTSRPLHPIICDLSGLPFISMDDIEHKLLADIQLHVTRELDARHRLRDLEVGLKVEICRVLCRKAGGMFRWIQCSINTLDRCVTRKEVRSALDNLPEGLDETYGRILLAVDAKGREGRLARRALTWLVAAVRPLRLNELIEGLSINLEMQTLDPDFGPMHHGALLDACGSLVAYNERTHVIILSHFSVKEYLMGDLIPMHLLHYHINWERANLELVRACIYYLCIDLEPRSCNTTGGSILATGAHGTSSALGEHPYEISRPLRDYAVNNAINHFQHLGCQFELVLHDIKLLAHATQQNHRKWNNLCRSARWAIDTTSPTWPPSKHDFILYILVAFAPNLLLRTFLRHTALKEGTNPLIYAVYFNKEEHAHTLLSRGARLNRRGWDISGLFQVLPIEVAMQMDRYTMVKLFMEEGSTLPSHIFTYPFIRPYKHIPHPIMRVLVQTDAFAEAVINPLYKGLEVFFDCLLAGNMDTSEPCLILIILRRLTQLSCDNNSIWTMLRLAVKQHRVSAVQPFLSLGVSLPVDLLQVALTSPSKNGSTASITKCLLEGGVSLHIHAQAGNKLFRTALQSCPNDEEAYVVVKLLVDHSCYALEAISFPAAESILHLALKRGFTSTTRYLLSLGTPPSLDLLHATLRCFPDEDETLRIAKWLIESNCDPREANSNGETPLHITVKRGFVSITQYLLSLGISPPPNILHLASTLTYRQKRILMITCLLENKVLGPTVAGETVFCIVLRLSKNDDDALEATKLLVGHRYDPRRASSTGETPLQIAVRCGFVSVTQYLLSLSDITPPPNLLHIALKLADNQQRTLMVSFLLENGFHGPTVAELEESVFCIVLRLSVDENEALKATKLLVDHRYDPCESSSSGETPLHIAVKRGFVSIAQYLLSLGISPPLDLLLIALTWTYQRNRISMITYLLENGVHIPTATTESVVCIALRSLDVEDDILKATKLLVGRGCDPCQANSSGETPLHIAVKRGFVSIAQYLLSLGISPPLDLLLIALTWTYQRNRISMITYLLENGVHIPTATTESVVCIVLQSLDVEDDVLKATKLLVGRGCDPCQVNSLGETPLHIAVKRGFVSIAQYLFSLGVYPPFPMDHLHVVLTRVSQRKIVSMVACLLENGVHPSTIITESVIWIVFQALHRNVEDEVLKVVKLLVGHGYDPHKSSPSGEILLRIAVKRGFVSIAQYLLSIGISTASNFLHVALTLANKRTRMLMIACLVENKVHGPTIAGDPVFCIILRSLEDEDEALEAAKLLVSHRYDPREASSSEGDTPLFIAVRRGLVSVARYLLSLSISPPPDILHCASILTNESKRLSMIACLLENGVTVSGGPILPIVLRSCHDEKRVLQVVKQLPSYTRNPVLGASWSRAEETELLHIAVQRGLVSITQYLLFLDVSPSPDLLHIALGSKSWMPTDRMIVCLLENGANIHARNAQGDPVLHAALLSSANEDEALNIVKLLVCHGGDPLEVSSSGKTLLYIAIERRFVSVVRYLLSCGVRPTSDLLLLALFPLQEWELLQLLRHLQNRAMNNTTTLRETLELLIDVGCNPLEPGSGGNIPLCVAIEQGHFIIGRILLVLSFSFPSSQSPYDILWIVVKSKQFRPKFQVVNFLINQSVDVLAKTEHGNSLLHVVVATIDREEPEVLQVVRLLLKRGANPSAPNLHGVTPLHAAVERGHVSIVKLLSRKIQLSSDILFTAIQSNPTLGWGARLRIVKALVDAGCNPSFRNSAGLTPLDAACREGHRDVFDYLLSAVTRPSVPQ